MKNYKVKEHFERRFKMWLNGEFSDLFEEGKAIQARLSPGNNVKQRQLDLSKSFRSLMLSGKVKAALRLLDMSENKGVLPIT